MFLGFELGLELVLVLVLAVQLELLHLLPQLPLCRWWADLGVFHWEDAEATLTLLVIAGPREEELSVLGTSCS